MQQTRSLFQCHQPSYFHPGELLSIEPHRSLRKLILTKIPQSPEWLKQQMYRLHQDPQIEHLTMLLDSPQSFYDLVRAIAIHMPNNFDTAGHLHHIRLESQAARLQIASQQYRKLAEEHIDKHRQMRKDIDRHIKKLN